MVPSDNEPQRRERPAAVPAKGAEKPEPARSPLPSPTLPKSGGAIRDIGEKFSANPATGAASMSIPVFTSGGRGGFHPELALQYDSGKGNGPYGVGWSLSVPAISRRTDKGLPRYFDAQESDTFILSGAEDLVPALTASGARDEFDSVDPSTGTPYHVIRYRPRVESSYARIERWIRQPDGDLHWRSITKSNTASIYGRGTQARVADPEQPRRVFSWLLEETRDGKGNVIHYEYVPEDQQNIDQAVGFERSRAVANSYLKRIYYGNQTPDVAGDWHFQVLFDYGEHDKHDPVNGPVSLWPGRQDPFSDFRPTFEERTYRLCRRILMLHHFSELGASWTAVRSTDLKYEENPIATYLRAATQRGWLRRTDGSYDSSLALPPIDLDYSRPTIEPTIHDVDPDSLANLPLGADGHSYQLLDLDGEGLPGVITEQTGAFFYKRSDGDGRFDPVTRIVTKPAIAELDEGLQQLTDVDGSGAKFLVQLGQRPQGYFERTDGWSDFHAFASVPNLDWQDRDLKYLDLDGDGLPDVLKAEGDLFRWWGSLGRDGYGVEHRVPQPRDDDKGPFVAWTDSRQSIVIADMTGDGLPDLVRIRNGSVEYWPNRGYGRFGARVIMRNAPRFTSDDQFTPALLRLADVDGSGTADLLYLEHGVARVWMNQSGNGYANEQRVPFPSPADTSITVTDLLGKGTACLVWSSPLPNDQGRQMRYLDLMSGVKPHLLTSIANNLGAVTTIAYAPSTKFYLDDRRAGLPWITKLPFPTQVVQRIEIDETVTATKLVTTYRYHHGHYDGREREFAGFGMVEQEDAETLQEGLAPPIAYTPPKRTKTWFHTGAFFDAETVSTQYTHEYNKDFPQLLPDSLLPPSVLPEEAREAARALRGHVLRQEIFGVDGSPSEPDPYAITESNFEIRRLQPKADNRYAVFDVVPRETLSVHTERAPGDPRVEHDITLAVDVFGNVTETVHVGYGRSGSSADAVQRRTLVRYAQTDYVTLTNGSDYYRVDLLRESRTYELTGLAPPSANGIYSHSEAISFATLVNGPPALEIDFSVTTPPATPARRLYERTRQIFVGDQPSDDRLRALGLIVDTQRAALTPVLVDNVYQALVSNPTARTKLLTDNGYISDQGLWWAPTGTTSYPAGLFFQPQQFVDPFGNVSSVGYDTYGLLVSSATSAVGTPYSTTTAMQNDYAILAPALLTDANGNRTQVGFDALGRVVASWVTGKTTESVGDDPAHPSTRIEYHLETIPAYVYVEKREEHWSKDPSNTKLQRAYGYSDGLGREVLTKKQAQPDAAGAARWIGTGRTVFDNKGNPVQKYEPYFSATPSYEAVIKGVSDFLHYDPLNRVVRTDHPNGAYSRIEFGELVQTGTAWTNQLNAWGQASYDENDTLGETGNAWYARFSGGSADEQDAAAKALAHSGTPTRTHVDALGRTYRTEQDNGFDTAGAPTLFATTLELDIQANQRIVTDARAIAVATHTFDMLGRRLVTASVDAGNRTALIDVAGATAHEWNPNAIEIAREYDPLRRPRRVWVTDSGGTQRLAERTVYGETLTDGAVFNLRGRIFCQLDGAGLVKNARFDFKGNLLSTERQLATAYDQQVDWNDIADPSSTSAALGVVGLDAESFSTASEFDALNRVVRLQMPSATPNVDHVALPAYNETGLLGSVGVKLDGSATTTPFVTKIDYNEKLQRLQIAYGNGVTTAYTYEPDTFRLSTISTSKTAPSDLQALGYTYDPIGNVTTIEDNAQQTLFVGNSKISPRTRYTFDAIYRLIYALGREHSGQALPDQTSTPDGVPIPSPTDPQAMRLYAETYQYDAVGNFLAMIHAVTNSAGQFQNLWTRTYTPDANSNRLLSTVTGDATTSTPTTYSHDLAGNITAMSPAPLPTIDWDYRNQLVHAVSTRGDTYCAYDGRGQRVRKVLVPTTGPIKERIYLGNYEIYREHGTGASHLLGPVILERRTLHVNDDRQRVALVELRTKGNDGSPIQLIRYQLDNHLGSAALEVGVAANLLSYEEYHPYGTTSYRATDGILASIPKRYAFIQRERDEETGLYYVGARYYSPWLGRWTAPDPAQFVDGVNLFSYAHDNPVRYLDRTGNDTSNFSADDKRAANAAIQRQQIDPEAAAVLRMKGLIDENSISPASSKTTPKHVVADKGWQEAKAQETKQNATANAARIIPLIPKLEAELRAQNVTNIPLPLLLGWISQESSGDPSHVEPGKDEVGLFQVSKEERLDYLRSTEPGGKNDVRAKMMGPSGKGNADNQIREGVQLIKKYEGILVRHGLSSESPALPELVRFGHNIGISTAARLVDAIRKDNDAGRTTINPSTASWSQIVDWAAEHKSQNFLNHLRTPDYATLAGQEIERLNRAAQVPQP